MLINYFYKYNIDTSNINEKLNIISKCKDENASYITHIFNNTINYLFKSVELNCSNIKEINFDECNENVIYFDTITDEKILQNIQVKSKLLVIGMHKTRKINDNIFLINIKDFPKYKNIIESFDKVSILFNIDNINFSKYYYGRMRTYFLNVLDSLNNIDIEKLKNDVEQECTNILLDKNNFNNYFVYNDNALELKSIMLIYSKIIFLTKVDNVFYISNSELDDMKKMMLNEISNLIKLYDLKNDDEMISYAYDYISNMLHQEAIELNYCNFIDNKCASSRYTKGFPNSKENGCCSNTYMDKGKDCRYLKKDHSCAIEPISCRAFSCLYLQNRGIDHSLWQYPLIDLYIKTIYLFNCQIDIDYLNGGLSMKKCIIVILVIVLIIILGLGTLYAIDMYRMDNNLPVVFSTWGYNYAPPIKPINSGESNSGEVQIGSIKTKLEDLPKDLSNFEEEHVFI